MLGIVVVLLQDFFSGVLVEGVQASLASSSPLESLCMLSMQPAMRKTKRYRNSTSSHSSTSSQRKNDKFWTVDVIDDQSVTKEIQLNMQGIWLLPVGERIILHFNESRQPIGEAGGLIAGFLGTVATDVGLFPISYRVWKKVPKSSKEKCYYDIIKEKFHFEDAIGKRWILGSIANHWRNNRCTLFKKFYKFERSREENIEKHPPWIPKEMWIAFVDYRLDPATVEKITEIEMQQTSCQMIGQQDSLAQVLGPEPTGRVRGLGFGPTPSQVFKNSGIQISRNARGGVSKDRLAQLESQLQSETERRKTLENFMQYIFKGVYGNTPIPPEFAQILNPEAGDRNEPCPSSSASHEPRA
ncbi:hypothetical protein G2W53_013884 [Senna tora]|uniref:Transposase, Ptta/En/Spm, plant n=1 Tax=Senna tora TaxID=362788 RepID=A0A834U2T8_9FABA|nr:hypothetical protein G2W53_013884 [Senna tora]